MLWSRSQSRPRISLSVVFKLGQFCPQRRHLAMPRNIFGDHSLVGASGSKAIEVGVVSKQCPGYYSLQKRIIRFPVLIDLR